MSQVIAAVSTGQQVSAIGILRVSGEGAIALCARVFSAHNQKPLTDAPNHKMVLGHLLDKHGRVLDEILAVAARAPHSYTGEETVEFQCHGSPAVLAAGLESLFAAGARQALPGEFTKRAFLNGQLDLSQAEAVIDLIEADSADAAANAAGQLGGAISRKIDPIYEELAGICAHFHAVLDYPDEDIEDFQLKHFSAQMESALDTLAALRATCDRGALLKDGLSVVILGKPNVGKSSLLNALAGYERVIVTDIAGTTRDAVTETLKIGAHKLRLTDTAGIRETEDAIEAMGVEIAEKSAARAKLALCVFDGSRPLTQEDTRVIDAAYSAEQSIAILNKIDLPPQTRPSDLPFDLVVPMCAKESFGLDQLEAALEMLYPADAPCDGAILTNVRQAAAIDRAGIALSDALHSMRAQFTPDAVLVDVETALEALGEITGKTMREEITSQIFSRFCVGK